jgi:hypothetical protein
MGAFSPSILVDNRLYKRHDPGIAGTAEIYMILLMINVLPKVPYQTFYPGLKLPGQIQSSGFSLKLKPAQLPS